MDAHIACLIHEIGDVTDAVSTDRQNMKPCSVTLTCRSTGRTDIVCTNTRVAAQFTADHFTKEQIQAEIDNADCLYGAISLVSKVPSTPSANELRETKKWHNTAVELQGLAISHGAYLRRLREFDISGIVGNIIDVSYSTCIGKLACTVRFQPYMRALSKQWNDNLTVKIDPCNRVVAPPTSKFRDLPFKVSLLPDYYRVSPFLVTTSSPVSTSLSESNEAMNAQLDKSWERVMAVVGLSSEPTDAVHQTS